MPSFFCRRLRRLLPLLFAGALVALPARGQGNLGEALQSVGSEYAANYTQPVTDALGADLNAGLFRTAEVGGGGLVPLVDVYVGVAVPGALTAGSAESFRLSDETLGNGLRIDYPDRPLPTAFGDGDLDPGRAVVTQNGRPVGSVELPSALVSTPIAPLVIPQVGVGTVLGTDAQVRYLPETSISDYGSVSITGVAVRHSISQYIPLSPVSVAVQGSWQNISLSDSANEVLTATGWAVNAQVSKTLPLFPLTFYGGLQYESFGVEVDYTFDEFSGAAVGAEPVPISFEQDAQNRVRGLAGVSLTLALLRVNVDYAISGNNTVSAGVGIVL
jgi:hypothetical protein